jgi:nitrate reductase delta subunit
MAATFKALSALLAYPSAALQAATAEIRDALAGEGLLPPAAAGDLDRLVDEIAGGDLLDLQERYVQLFDRSRSLSLHLFEHVHGESRDRGQAMIDLQGHYARSGLAIASAELPDFLPVFLEFLSTRPLGEAKELLGQTAHIVAALAARLARRGSAYAGALAALTAIAAAGAEGAQASPAEAGADGDPDDPAMLDAGCQEAPVMFGPEAAGGCRDELVARLRAAKRPAPGSA